MTRRSGAAVPPLRDRSSRHHTSTQNATGEPQPRDDWTPLDPGDGPACLPGPPTQETAPGELFAGAGPAVVGPNHAPAPAAAASVEEAVDAAETRWGAGSEFTPQTLARVGETVHRFARRLNVQGVEHPSEVTVEHCRGFVTAHTGGGQPPELTTQHARRTALRMLFRTWREVGLTDGDPTLDLVLPTRSSTAARPLTDVEVTLCRASARLGESGSASLQRAVAWALGEATAVSSEISAVRLADLDDPDQPRWVHLPGTRRHDPRLGELTDWGSRIIGRQVEVLRSHHAPATTPLAYRGAATPGQATAQAAACNALGAVLDLAGLSTEADVRPASLRNWAGRTLYDGGMPIEQVARRMGARKLDQVAEDLALAWRLP